MALLLVVSPQLLLLHIHFSGPFNLPHIIHQVCVRPPLFNALSLSEYNITKHLQNLCLYCLQTLHPSPSPLHFGTSPTTSSHSNWHSQSTRLPREFPAASCCGGPEKCYQVHPWRQQAVVIELTRTNHFGHVLFVILCGRTIWERPWSATQETENKVYGTGCSPRKRTWLDKSRSCSTNTEYLKRNKQITINSPRLHVKIPRAIGTGKSRGHINPPRSRGLLQQTCPRRTILTPCRILLRSGQRSITRHGFV